jgi:hypothetical protein
MTKKKTRFVALPLLNMPKRSHETEKPPSRPARSVVEAFTDMPPRKHYKNFSELCKRVAALKSLSGWNLKISEDRVILKRIKDSFLLPEVEIIIDDSLGFTIKMYGCYVPENHLLYTKYLRSIRNITVHDLVKEIDCFSLCCGVENVSSLTSQLIHHVIPMAADPLCEDEHGQMFPHKAYWRAKTCSLICDTREQCEECADYVSLMLRETKAKDKRLSTPVHLKAPVSKTAPERL